MKQLKGPLHSINVGVSSASAAVLSFRQSTLRNAEIMYEESDKIGEGAFGRVYKGKCRGIQVAVKIPLQIDEDALEDFEKEIKTMASISHPRIAMFLGAYVGPSGVKIVMELLHDDMEHILLADRKSKKISLYQRVVWAKQALHEYLLMR